VRLVGAFVADRAERQKEVAGIGYALSAVCKLLLLAVGASFGPLAAVVALDRAGKGLRAAPRDALLSLSCQPRDLALAFGVHRALDTVGAVVGPVAAFALLSLVPNGFDAVFVVSFFVALVGLAVLVLFVEKPKRRSTASARISVAHVIGLLRARNFRALALAAIVLAVATVSDAFVYLLLQRRLGFAMRFVPLMYVATALFYMALAAPAGRAADRFGRKRVFLVGYVSLALVYAVLLAPVGHPMVLAAIVLALLGGYYAATDGVIAALASEVLPAEVRTSGLAILSSATGLGRVVGSLGFGWLWTCIGAQRSIGLALGALVFCGGIAATVLARGARLQRSADHG
jgi:MFS family permease